MGQHADVAQSLEERKGDVGSMVVNQSKQQKQESKPYDGEDITVLDNSSNTFLDDSSDKQPPSVLQDEVKRELIGPRNFRLCRSRSCKASFASNDSFITFDASDKNHVAPPSGYERDYCERPDGCHRLSSALKHDLLENTQNLQNYLECMIENECLSPRAESTTDQRCLSGSYSPSEEDNETMAWQEKSATQLVVEVESKISETEKRFRDVSLNPIHDDSETPGDWITEFKWLQKDVIKFWNACNVSLAHRTYFFLLFKGGRTDKVYMEGELRRLSLIKQRFIAQADGQVLDVASSSLRDIRRERQMLSKQLQKKFTRQEKENLFRSWHIDLSSKNRSLQLADRLWTSTEDMDHIARSAQIVGNLIGFVQPEQHSSEEMFGHNFTPRRLCGKTSWWKSTVRSLL